MSQRNGGLLALVKRAFGSEGKRRLREQLQRKVRLETLESRQLLTGVPPVAVADSYSVAEDQTLTVLAATGVLSNDTDAESDSLTAVINTQPANGLVTLDADGAFVYTPDPDFFGTDSFTYHANDGSGDSNVVTVTLTITPANDAPVAADDAYTVAEDGVLTVPVLTGVLANDSDVDANALTAAVVAQPTHGALSLAADGSFTYTPDGNFSGTDTFTYRANDGATDSNIATVTITVTAANDAPVAVADSYSVAEDGTLTVAVGNGVLTNDTDADNNTLTAVLNADVSNGVLTLAANGSFTYVPDANFSGTDSFTYHANDGTADSNIVTVTITVTAANDAPVGVADSYAATEDTTLTVVAANGVLANDTDVENTPLTATLVGQATSGVVTLAADGSFTYVPSANFNGTDSFTYTASDGVATSAITTVTITVAAANDAPVAVADSYTVAEDGALTTTVINGVLQNDTDVEGNPLTAVLNTNVTNGTLTLAADGSFTYSPNANFNGTDSFTYHANDGTSDSNIVTVTITVTAVADAPVAVADAYSVAEDGTLTIAAATGVLANDTDADASPLTAVLNTNVANGVLTLNADGSFTYAPIANFNGTDTFTYHANDGTANSNVVTVTITVTPVNDVPVAVADSYTATQDQTLTVTAANGLLANDTDADGNTLTAALVSQASHGVATVAADGSFTYVPTAAYFGADSFTYTASDASGPSAAQTVSITVNAPPVAVNDSYSVAEDQTLTVTVANSVLLNDTDADIEPLTATLVGQAANGTVSLNADGSFTYVPNANFAGTDTFTYRANDGDDDSNLATVTITVTAVNDAPVAVADAYSVTEGNTLTVTTANGVLVNDTDPDAGATLSAVIVAQPTNGSVTLAADGSFTYTPTGAFNGTDTFTYKANDGTVDSNVVTVTITVTPTNTAPVAVADTGTVAEDGVLTVNAVSGVLANDTDAESNPLTAIKVTDPTNGVLVLNSDGSYTYTPNANFNGTDSFTYKANDGTADSNVVTVTITVTAVNDVPVAVADSYTVAEDGTLTTTVANSVLVNDTDADTGSTLTAIIVAQPTNGVVAFNANGTFVYTPAANFNGSDSFTYKANDGVADSNVVTVTITVTSVNDAPVAVADSYTVAEDGTLTTTLANGVLSNDTDVDAGATLTATILTQPTNGSLTFNANGTFTYTPNANFSGSDTFTYMANDGSADSAATAVTITVTPLNDAPIAVADNYTATEDTPLTVAVANGVLANDTDADAGNTLTAVVVTQPAHGVVTLNPNGSFTYTPSANYNGADSFTYKANDGTVDSNTVTVTLTITAVNDTPVGLVDNYTTSEDTVLTVPAATGVLANDSDVEGSPLTATIATQPSSGTVTLAANGSFVYTPAANFNGVATFTYTVSDGAASSAPITVSITVTAVNDAPTGVADAYTVVSGTTLTVPVASGVLANDTDPDANTTLTTLIVTTTANGTLTLNPNGSFTYTPNAGFSGTDTFVYRASDGTLQSANTTVTITVTAAASTGAPVISGPNSGVKGETLTFTLSTATGTSANVTYAIDYNGDGTTDQTITGPGNGTTVTRAFATAGTFNLRVTANGQTTTRTITITDSVRSGNTLTVGGTSGDDVIRVIKSGRNGVQVLVNNVRVGGVQTGIKTVVVMGGDGNDRISMQSGMNMSAKFYGGAGNDTLIGGSYADFLYGDAGDDILNGMGGNDFLQGGLGNDSLIGGAGHDVLFGSEGADTLNGGGGYDLMIGGTTTFGGDPKVQAAILHAWAGGGTFQQRMNRLNANSGGTLKLIAGQTVLSDSDADRIISGDADWIFALAGDSDVVTGGRKARIVRS